MLKILTAVAVFASTLVISHSASAQEAEMTNNRYFFLEQAAESLKASDDNIKNWLDISSLVISTPTKELGYGLLRSKKPDELSRFKDFFRAMTGQNIDYPFSAADAQTLNEMLQFRLNQIAATP